MVARLNILVVEDNEQLREATLDALRSIGHNVDGVDCAEAVPEQQRSFDLMLIDLNLPGEDGLALAQRMRAIQPDIGIIMVTARGLPDDKRQGYECGADIYMPKPVLFDELCAAIQSLGRRLGAAQDERIVLDQERLSLIGRNGMRADLSGAECMLLIAFVRAAEQRLENWQMIELLNKEHAQDPKAALELQIVRLRKKLQQAGARTPSIRALRGMGYQLLEAIRLQ